MRDIILVNNEDYEIGTATKKEVHQKGLLHRAFSVLLYRQKNNRLELLLQKRAKVKYHSAELWTNTCCSHPGPNESIESAAARRLKEELGITGIALKNIGSFHYRAELCNGLVENEIDHVLIGCYRNEKISLNPNEVSDIQWVEVEKLDEDLQGHANHYTVWLIRVLGFFKRFNQL